MIFITNFMNLLPKDKSNMSYEEFFNRFINKLKYYQIEYKGNLESLLKTLYLLEDKEYLKTCKGFSKTPYTVVMEYPLEVEDIITNEDVDTNIELNNFSNVYKKAYSIINRVYDTIYIEFMNNDYSKESYETLKEFVDNIVEDNSEILERVSSEFDDYLYDIEASPFLMSLADEIRKTFDVKIIKKGKQEVIKFDRLINYKIKGEEYHDFREHIELEKRRKHARYN